jgi:drug/metabolite transporter (DMT)-like permease
MSHTEKPQIPPVVLVLAAVILWSTGGLFIKLTTLDSFAVNCGRSLFAAIVVAVFTYRKGLKIDLFTFFVSFLYAGTLTCFVYATKNTTAANAIFLQYTAPIYILLLSPLILGEKFQYRDLLTVVLCIGGMSLFFVENRQSLTAPNIFSGNVAALISGVFFGLYMVFLRHPRSLTQNPAVSVFYGNLIIAVVMLPFIFSNPPVEITIRDWVAVTFLGVFQIGIAYILFTKGLAAGVRAMDASIVGFIEPLFNPLWVFLFVGERPTAWAVLGGAVIVLTVALHTIRQNRLKEPFVVEA